MSRGADGRCVESGVDLGQRRVRAWPPRSPRRLNKVMLVLHAGKGVSNEGMVRSETLVRSLERIGRAALTFVRYTISGLVLLSGVWVVSAGLYLAGATIYKFKWSELSPPSPPIIPAEVSPESQGSSAATVVPDDVIESAPRTIAASTMFGMKIYGPNDELVGEVTEVIMDRRGSAQAIVVGLDGFWTNKKYVLIPFASMIVYPQSAPTNEEPIAVRAERGVIPYSVWDLQKLPKGSHPLFPSDN